METIGLKKTIIAKAPSLVKKIEYLVKNKEIFTEKEVELINLSEFIELNFEIAERNVSFFEKNGFNNIDEILLYYESKLELGYIPDTKFELNDGTKLKIEDVCSNACLYGFIFSSLDKVWTNCGCDIYRVEDFSGKTLYYTGQNELLKHKKADTFYIPEKNLDLPLKLQSKKFFK